MKMGKHNDTPALNASQHWAAPPEGGEGENPLWRPLNQVAQSNIALASGSGVKQAHFDKIGTAAKFCCLLSYKSFTEIAAVPVIYTRVFNKNAISGGVKVEVEKYKAFGQLSRHSFIGGCAFYFGCQNEKNGGSMVTG